jgi:hypothetical protein
MDIPLVSPTVVVSPTSSWSSGYSACSTLFASDAEEEELVTSIMTRDIAQVRSLTEAGTSITERNTWVLYHACLKGVSMVQVLLASSFIDFNTSMVELQGDATLHLVLRTPADRFYDPKVDVVKLLVRKGVKPLQRDRLGDTALHILAGDATDESTELLGYLFGDAQMGSADTAPEDVQIECRAQVNLQNDPRYNNTPLVIAVLYNHLNCIKLLLDYGADPQICGEGGYSAIEFAQKRQLTEALRLLGAPSENSRDSQKC